MESERLRETIDLDKRHVWHPFTQMREWTAPLVIEAAEGNYLIDAEGRRYLDGVSSLWVTVHGHRRREIDDAIRAQLDRVAHSTLLGLAHEPAARLAARLAAVTPGQLDRVFYSDSGSTAVEIALKQAFQYWQHRGRRTKRLFVHLEDAYHGDTLGAVSVGGIGIFHEVFGPLLTENLSIPTPHPWRYPERTPDQVRDACLDALDRLLSERRDEVAAVVVEPLVQGAAGMIVHPEGFLRGVAERCRRHEVLLIADEVATGFGRTGRMFACEHEDVVPDFLCVAKGITGGYLPLAATITHGDVYEAFLGARAEAVQFFHGHTYTGNPLACAAAVASLDLFERDEVLAGLPAKVERLRARLAARVAPADRVGEVRQRGLMVGIELAENGTRAPLPPDQFTGARVCEAARAHGLILRPLGDVVVLMPPLSIELEEIDALVDGVAAAIAAVCG